MDIDIVIELVRKQIEIRGVVPNENDLADTNDNISYVLYAR